MKDGSNQNTDKLDVDGYAVRVTMMNVNEQRAEEEIWFIYERDEEFGGKDEIEQDEIAAFYARKLFEKVKEFIDDEGYLEALEYDHRFE